MKTRAWLLLVPLLTVPVTSCDVSNAPPLPEGYGPAVTRAFTVRLDVPVNGADGLPARVRAFNGLDGLPISPTGDSALAFSQRAGVKVLRHPVGWGCQLTMDVLFPDAGGDPLVSDWYHTDDLKNLQVESVARSMLPMWQTVYDIGQGTCTPVGGVGTGGRIGDVDTWAAVATRITARMSSATSPYFSADATAQLARQSLRPGYIEFLPDALVSAAYSNGGLASLLPVWVAWRRAFDTTFTVDGPTRIQALVGPSLPASDASDTTTPGRSLKEFLDYVGLDKTLAPEVLSFLSDTSTPEQHLALVRATRKALDDMGLSAVQVGDTALRLSDEAWASLSVVYDSTARRSAYLAAFLASVKILEQDDLDLMVASRWAGPRATADAVVGEDLFQDAAGEPLPAMVSLSPFSRMDQAKATRVLVTPVPWSVTTPAVDQDVPAASDGVVASALATDASPDVADGDTGSGGESPSTVEGDALRVMAALRQDGGLTAVVASLPPAIPARGGVKMRYQLDVQGLPATTAKWQVVRYHVDASSIGLRGPLEQTVVVPVQGAVRIARDITGPAVDQIEIVPVQ